MKKIIMTVGHIGEKEHWTEAYSIEDHIDPYSYAEDMIKRFNNTLRTGEKPRKLLRVLEDATNKGEIGRNDNHVWEKQNATTIIKGNSIYDNYKCLKCGITGKRFGLSSFVKRDARFKANCYLTCEGALKQMKRNKLRKEKHIENPKMSWVIYQGKCGKYAQPLIRTKKEAEQFQTTAYAVNQNPNILPVVVNRVGGYSSFNPNDKHIVKIVQSDDEPHIPFDERYCKNPETLDCGWISPDGDAYQCSTYDHYLCAGHALSEFFHGANSEGRPDEYLLNNGWIKVYWGNSEKRIRTMSIRNFDRITPKQLLAIEKYKLKSADDLTMAMLRHKHSE